MLIRPSLHESLELSLYQAQTATYETLHVQDMIEPHWIVSHVLFGAVETATCGFRYSLRTGDVMVHPPGLPFSEYSTTPGTHQWMALDIRMSAHVELFRLYSISPVVRLTQPEQYRANFSRLEAAWQQPVDLARDLLVLAQTVTLVGLLIDSWVDSGSVSRPDEMSVSADRLAGVVAYMRSHLPEKLTRGDLAARVFLHPHYFNRVFLSTYGVSPMRMLRELRLLEAQRLLESTGATAASIAADCGFADAASLSRAFGARFGMAPGRYRESVKMTKTRYSQPLSKQG